MSFGAAIIAMEIIVFRRPLETLSDDFSVSVCFDWLGNCFRNSDDFVWFRRYKEQKNILLFQPR
jgi:hypothetical protein